MLVLDANILIRAVLGSRVLFLLRKFSETSEFVATDSAFYEARKELPGILARRGRSAGPAMEALDLLPILIQTVELDRYAPFEAIARRRLFRRDENDWPILAAALLLNCPIWTEDTDFFGCGVPTWTSDRIEIYLDPTPPPL